MNSAIERLLSLRVGDMMTPAPIRLSQSQTMQEAASLLVEHDISGAPVVDDRGVCAGVLTTTDFVQREFLVATPSGGSSMGSAEGRPDLVGDCMTSFVHSVQENATMMVAARVMCDEHIHRIVVLDELGRPVGVVTALDVVAALKYAIEE
ncbi:MAG: hypothetical protein CMJ65_11285 [Planctomycetaceae bacterium]|jgi:CBS-domain-containing membrane protein|nr:hypothetical protein [Planctomycetaceae bacterium]MDP7277171.1 CBS domain-containing protein [Planctomycetaceae bacterium]